MLMKLSTITVLMMMVISSMSMSMSRIMYLMHVCKRHKTHILPTFQLVLTIVLKIAFIISLRGINTTTKSIILRWTFNEQMYWTIQTSRLNTMVFNIANVKSANDTVLLLTIPVKFRELYNCIARFSLNLK